MKHAGRRDTKTTHESHIENRKVKRKFYRHKISLDGCIRISQTSKISRGQRGDGQSQIYLAGDTPKRKYEDMTSLARGIERGAVTKDDNLMSRLNSYHENKRGRPPELYNLMQLQESATERMRVRNRADELQIRKEGSRRRFRSGPEIVATEESDNCEESDLTAELHMAEESSRSSKNDGSTFESAAESVSRDARLYRDMGVVDYFRDQTNEGCRELPMSSTFSPSHTGDAQFVSNRSGHFKNKDTGSTAELYSWPSGKFRDQPTQQTSSVTDSLKNIPASQVWGNNMQEWLQLGVGSSRDTVRGSSLSDVLTEGRDNMPDKFFSDWQLATSISFPIPANRDAGSISLLHESNVSSSASQRRIRDDANAIASASKMLKPNRLPIDSSVAKSVVASISETGPAAHHVGQTQLCLFGRSISTQPLRTQVLPDPHSSSTTRPIAIESERVDQVTSSTRKAPLETLQIRDENFRAQMAPRKYYEFGHAGSGYMQGGQSQARNQSGTSFSIISSPADDDHFRSAQAPGTSTDQVRSLQSQEDSVLRSRSAGMQWRDNRYPGQASYSWPPGPVGDLGPKYTSFAQNLQGWNPPGAISSIRLPAGATGYNGQPEAVVDRQLRTAVDQLAGRGSNEWGSSVGNAAPSVLLQSQSRRPELSSLVLPRMISPNNQGERNLVAVRRNTENIQSMPRLPTPEGFNVESVGIPWSRESAPSVSIEESWPEAQNFGGERSSLMSSSALSQIFSGESRFSGGGSLNLLPIEQPPIRRNWKQAVEQKTSHAEDPDARHNLPISPAAAKPIFRVLPSGPREKNQAGFWFALRSAQNQTGEGSLPQLSKAYLRIKDGNMPVSAVKKYLATKLGLTSESEVEITCNGHPVQPSAPLQQVRDFIWYPSMPSNSSAERTFASTSSDEPNPRTSAVPSSQHQQRGGLAQSGGDQVPAAAKQTLLFQDLVMVLTYSKPPPTSPS